MTAPVIMTGTARSPVELALAEQRLQILLLTVIALALLPVIFVLVELATRADVPPMYREAASSVLLNPDLEAERVEHFMSKGSFYVVYRVKSHRLVEKAVSEGMLVAGNRYAIISPPRE